jgi:hypothetical protein
MQNNNEEEYLDFEEENEEKKTGETNGKQDNKKGYVSYLMTNS